MEGLFSKYHNRKKSEMTVGYIIAIIIALIVLVVVTIIIVNKYGLLATNAEKCETKGAECVDRESCNDNGKTLIYDCPDEKVCCLWV